jgi:putative endonuclease
MNTNLSLFASLRISDAKGDSSLRSEWQAGEHNGRLVRLSHKLGSVMLRRVQHLLCLSRPTRIAAGMIVRENSKRCQEMKNYYIYILANRSKNLYTGVTNNLQRRIYEHKHHLMEGFTNWYHVTRLVYFEETSDVYAAISREKQIKGWVREKKVALIESSNPEWRDLSEDWEGA